MEMANTAADDHPKYVLEIARKKNYPVWMDDPRRRHWHGKTLVKLNEALAIESIAKAVSGEFTKQDSMRYPAINAVNKFAPNELRAVLTGLLAETVQVLKAHATFESEDEYVKAFDVMMERYPDWSLADFKLAFKRIQLGETLKSSYRFSIPELCQGLDSWQDFKVDQRERWQKNCRRYESERMSEAWGYFQDTMGFTPQQAKVSRVDWMNGKDVMSWSDKQKLQAKDKKRNS